MATIIETQEHKKIYREGDKLVKEFDSTFTKAEVLNEALNNARVEETGLKIPKLLKTAGQSQENILKVKPCLI